MKLDLSLEEINVLLNALGSQPYAQVFNLVAKIQQQAQEQLKPAEETNDPV